MREIQYLSEVYLKQIGTLPISKDTEDNYYLYEAIEEGYFSEWLYLLWNPLTNFYKIGITSNIKKRWMDLSNAGGVQLYLIMAINLEIGYDEMSKSLEKIAHDHFKSKRQKGEWFDLSIKNLIEVRNYFYSIGGWDILDNLKDHVKELNTKTKQQ